MAEEEVLADGGTQAGELVGGLGMERRFPIAVFVVGGGEGFGGDGGAAVHVVVGGHEVIALLGWEGRWWAGGALCLGAREQAGRSGVCGGVDGVGGFIFLNVGETALAGSGGVEAPTTAKGIGVGEGAGHFLELRKAEVRKLRGKMDDVDQMGTAR